MKKNEQKKYKCLIVDDERFARDLIEDYLKQYPEFEIIDKVSNIESLKQRIANTEKIDIIFLDIQMPRQTGIDYLRLHSIESKIVLTTAFPQYALESFKLNVFDYLLKPIMESRFAETITKLKKVLKIEDKATTLDLFESTEGSYLKIESGAKTHKIYFAELVRLESNAEYIKYITLNQDYLFLGSLKKILTDLPNNFVQIHRSHIVNTKYIQGREKYNLVMKDLTKIPIGKTYRTEVLKKVKELI